MVLTVLIIRPGNLMAFLLNMTLFAKQRAEEALQGHLLLICHKQTNKPVEIKDGIEEEWNPLRFFIVM